jgi:hypothetical protein
MNEIAVDYRDEEEGWIRVKIKGGMYPLSIEEARTLASGLWAALAQHKDVSQAAPENPWNAAVERMARVIRAHMTDAPAGYDPNNDPKLDAAVERAVPGFSGGMWEAAVKRARSNTP